MRRDELSETQRNWREFWEHHIPNDYLIDREAEYFDGDEPIFAPGQQKIRRIKEEQRQKRIQQQRQLPPRQFPPPGQFQQQRPLPPRQFPPQNQMQRPVQYPNSAYFQKPVKFKTKKYKKRHPFIQNMIKAVITGFILGIILFGVTETVKSIEHDIVQFTEEIKKMQED